MKPGGGRAKGAAYERELVHLFRDAMPGADVKRGLQMRSGVEVPDVDATPLWVEAKRGRKPNVRAALEQATRDASDGRIPVAVIRDDRAEAFVAMALTDFLEMVRDWWEVQKR